VFAAVVILLVAGIGVVLWRQSILSITKFGLNFWRTEIWNPVSGEFGAPLGSATTIPPGKSARLQVSIPTAEPWALRINDLPGVTSMGLADMERDLSGDGPLVYSTTVDDGGLSTSVSRGDTQAGETSAPGPN